MIRAVDHNVMEPTNIYDWDFYDSIVELPAPRPSSEVTPVSYLIAKARLLRPLGAVVDFINSPQHDSYETALKIDEQLSKAYSQMPPHIRIRNIEQTAKYSAATVNRMVQIEFLFHHGVCVLHRRFLVRNRPDNRFAHSRRQCIKSALAMLNQQSILYQVAKRTDSVQSLYWFRISSINQAFIFPAVILCLDLRYRRERLTNDNNLTSFPGVAQEKDLIDALRSAYCMWEESKDLSSDAWKAFQVLSQLLENLGIDTKGDDHWTPRRPKPPSSIPAQSLAPINDKSIRHEDMGISIDEMDIDWVSPYVLSSVYYCS